MIALEVCKNLLNKDHERHFTDEEVEEIRTYLYLMASLQIETEENNNTKSQNE